MNSAAYGERRCSLGNVSLSLAASGCGERRCVVEGRSCECSRAGEGRCGATNVPNLIWVCMDHSMGKHGKVGKLVKAEVEGGDPRS